MIAGEPSRLEVGVAEAGFVDAICEVRGVSAHGSFPELGDNAIEKAARLLLAVHDEPFTQVEHPLLGRNVPGTLWIEGGGELHVVPDRARARIEIRVVPGGPTAREVEGRLRALAAAHDADVELVEDSVEPFETEAGSPVLTALLGATARVSGEPAATVGVPAWTDAHNFVDLGRIAGRGVGAGRLRARARSCGSGGARAGRRGRSGRRGAARRRGWVARVIALDAFDELAGGLNHPEGVAWNPVDGLIYAGGEGGEIYAVTLEGERARGGLDRGVDARHRRRRTRPRVRVRRGHG